MSWFAINGLDGRLFEYRWQAAAWGKVMWEADYVGGGWEDGHTIIVPMGHTNESWLEQLKRNRIAQERSDCWS